MKRITALIMAVITAFFAVACTRASNSQNTVQITLYFANSQRNTLVEEQREITIGDKSIISGRDIMEELLKGPLVSDNKAVIPKNTTLISYTQNKGCATVNLSSDYYTYADSDNKDAIELLARYSIVSSLCTLSYINRVKILIDGNDLINAQGDVVGEISINDIISSDNRENGTAEKFITLYFSDKNAEYMYPERRRVQLVDNSIEKTIVTELISGTKSNDLTSVIPSDTKVLNVETKEGICFVNLSEDFVTKSSGSSAADLMTVYTIVNSLTELENVDKVQFLVDGSKLELYHDMLFSDPFERDDSFIGQK